MDEVLVEYAKLASSADVNDKRAAFFMTLIVQAFSRDVGTI